MNLIMLGPCTPARCERRWRRPKTSGLELNYAFSLVRGKRKKKEKSLSSRMRLKTDHINTTLLAAAQAAYIHKPIEYFPSGNYFTLHHQTKQSRAEQTEHRIGFNSALNRKPNPTQTQPKRQSDRGRTDAD